MATQNRRKWRNVLIMNRVQLMIAAVNLVYIILVVGIIMLIFMSPFYNDILYSETACEQRFSGALYLLLLQRLLPVVIFLCVAAFFHQMLLTHKICGPLVNFSHTFRRVTHKDLTRKVFLRRHDFLKEESHRINLMLDSLCCEIGKVRQMNLQALLALDAATDRRLDESDRLNAIERTQRAIQQNHELLSQFQLPENGIETRN